jgi:superoxide reductase
MSNKIYTCQVCGNVIELLHDGNGELVCCGKPMDLLPEKSSEEGQEKHLPVLERDGNNLKVKVGSVAHPMEESHYIEWIEINMIDVGRIAKKYLKPNDKPEVEFHVRGENFKIRSYCNLHGLWKNN